MLTMLILLVVPLLFFCISLVFFLGKPVFWWAVYKIDGRERPDGKVNYILLYEREHEVFPEHLTSGVIVHSDVCERCRRKRLQEMKPPRGASGQEWTGWKKLSAARSGHVSTTTPPPFRPDPALISGGRRERFGYADKHTFEYEELCEKCHYQSKYRKVYNYGAGTISHPTTREVFSHDVCVEEQKEPVAYIIDNGDGTMVVSEPTRRPLQTEKVWG